MMKKQVLLSSLALLGALSFGAMQPRQAQASSTVKFGETYTPYHPVAYHAVNPRQSAIVWNLSHTREVHNLRNFPHTTWYADGTYPATSGHEKLSYLHVISGNGRESGYVWHGYLKLGATTKAQTLASKRVVSRDGKLVVTANDVDEALNRQIAKLFPGTVGDSQLDRLADFQYLGMDDELQPDDPGDEPFTAASDINQLLGDTLYKSSFIIMQNNRLKNPRQSFSTFERAQLANYVRQSKHGSLKSFRNYHIGIYAFPKSSKFYGQAEIILMKPTTNWQVIDQLKLR